METAPPKYFMAMFLVRVDSGEQVQCQSESFHTDESTTDKVQFCRVEIQAKKTRSAPPPVPSSDV